MLTSLPDGREVPYYYQTHPVLGFMVKRMRDGLYWDEAAFRLKGREYWVEDRGSLHEFKYAQWVMRQAPCPCELEVVVDRYGEFTRPTAGRMSLP